MEIVESNKFGKLDDRCLKLFELVLGNRLPDDYREFISDYNGGVPYPCYFGISDSEGSSRVHHVYGLHKGPEYLQLDLQHNNYRARLPKEIIPIAEDPFGNQLCIVVSGPKRGSVFFWDHEKEPDTPDLNKITLIADSFSNLLERLFEFDEINDTSIENILDNSDIEALQKLISTGYDIETEDENGRTLIERSAIANKTKLIKFLFDQGAQLRNSLDLARKNFRFFPEHKESVDLIENLKKQD